MLSSMRVRLLMLLLSAGLVSCNRQQPGSEVPAVPVPVEMAHFEHVFVVVEENENYDEVIGNTTDLPYLNALAAKYGLATNYYANTHPSLNNYFYLTAGRAGTRSPWVGGTGRQVPRRSSGRQHRQCSDCKRQNLESIRG